MRISRIHGRQRMLILASANLVGAFFLSALILFNGYGVIEGTPIVPYTAFLVILGLLLLAGQRWLSVAKPKGLVWIHPPLLMTAWTLGMVGLPGLYSFFDRSVLESVRALVGVDYSLLVRGIALVAVGLLSLWIAYLGGLRIFHPFSFVSEIGKQQEPRLKWLMTFYAVGVIIQILQIRVTGLAYGADRYAWGILAPMQQWFVYVQDIYWVILAVVAVKVFRREWRWTPLVIILAIQAFLGFTSGFMKPVLWLGIVVILSAVVSNLKFRRLWLAALLMLILTILVVPVAGELRTQLDTEGSRSRDLATAVGLTGSAVENTWLKGPGVGWKLFVDKFLRRQASVAYMPGLIIGRTPVPIPYQGIEQFLVIPAYVIPRAFWPGKPVLSRGVWFSINYLDKPDFTTSSGAATIFGEGYMFAGWLGTVLACLILGLLLAFLYRNTVSAGLVPVFLALVPTIIDVDHQFTGMFVALIQRFVVFLIFYWLVATLSNNGRIRRSRMPTSHKQKWTELAG